jgi:hypothetical protein
MIVPACLGGERELETSDRCTDAMLPSLRPTQTLEPKLKPPVMY